jgi:hypothetical protein
MEGKDFLDALFAGIIAIILCVILVKIVEFFDEEK